MISRKLWCKTTSSFLQSKMDTFFYVLSCPFLHRRKYNSRQFPSWEPLFLSGKVIRKNVMDLVVIFPLNLFLATHCQSPTLRQASPVFFWDRNNVIKLDCTWKRSAYYSQCEKLWFSCLSKSLWITLFSKYQVSKIAIYHYFDTIWILVTLLCDFHTVLLKVQKLFLVKGHIRST